MLCFFDPSLYIPLLYLRHFPSFLFSLALSFYLTLNFFTFSIVIFYSLLHMFLFTAFSFQCSIIAPYAFSFHLSPLFFIIFSLLHYCIRHPSDFSSHLVCLTFVLFLYIPHLHFFLSLLSLISIHLISSTYLASPSSSL